jgi:parallel beta-helix repeat protein
MKAFVAFILLTLLLTTPLASGQLLSNLINTPKTNSGNMLELQFNFPRPIFKEDSGFTSIEISELPQYGAPGEPVLPFKMVNVLIPQGKKTQLVGVSTNSRRMLEGRYSLAFGRTPLPTSSNVTANDKPDEIIYNSANPFPNSLLSQMPEQYINGFRILPLRLYPIRYIPKTGEIYYFENITVTIFLETSTETSHFFRGTPEDLLQTMDLVADPDSLGTYTLTTSQAQRTGLASTSFYEYVIITNNALKSSFQTLVNWKITRGLTATVVLTEDILKDPRYNSDGPFGDGNSSPKFNDTQARIRNFIRDAYLNWGTKYVLLGGDDEIIPSRGVYCSGGYQHSYTDYNIPSDMYFGCLDSSWDKDNDTIFAEAVYPFPGPENGTAGEEADFFAEVYIGRAPVDTVQEAANFVAKIIAYEQNPQADYLKKALMIGEKLDVLTEGANSMDLVTDIIPQYSTTRLYTRDGNFSPTAVINNMNSGTHIINHDGHSSSERVMGLSTSAVDNLVNTEYFMIYSLGCYSAAFDEATTGSGEAIAEHFIYNAHGAFAYIGNTRYGWYVQGSTDGPGERYGRSFFSVLNSGIQNLGKALQLSKEQEPILDRWTYFDLNLLGDPETPIVTQIKAPTAHFETQTNLLTPPRIGGLVNIKGTAKRGNTPDATFSNFTIIFGQGANPTTWSTTGLNLSSNGQNEITMATLGTWNTTQVPAGTYTLKLSAFDSDGLTGEDRKIVSIDQSAISIYINADGSIDPPNVPVQRNGDVYTLTANIAGSGDGIVIERDNMRLDGAGHSIQGNNGYGAGIRLFSRSNVTIENMMVEGYLYGICLEQSARSMVLNCSVMSNTHGIFLLSSSNNNIEENDVTTNYDGISLISFSNNNSIFRNNITQNTGTITGGLCLFSSSNNSIHHNIFADNFLDVYDAAWDCPDSGLTSPSINFWDDGYPSGGNYWSDNTGVDDYQGPDQNQNGSDGIWDTGYSVDVNNQDNFPLTKPYGGAHDIGLVNDGAIKTIVGQGFNTGISIKVINYGSQAETFNVTVCINQTVILEIRLMLASRNSTAVGISLNTTTMEKGNNTVSARLDTVTGETETSDNTLNSCLLVTIPGDVNGDRTVDIFDAITLAAAFNSQPTSPNWNINVDINSDNIVDLYDAIILANHFTQHFP